MKRLMMILLCAQLAAAATTQHAASHEEASLATTIEEAYTYAYPVYDVARVRYHATAGQLAEKSALNRLIHRRTLADYKDRWVTTPNNDTLYSSAFLDLSGSPVEIDTPDFGDRYFSIAFMDAFTNNFAIVGRRTTGTKPQRYLIAGPGWHGTVPAGAKLISAPGNWVWVLVRTLVQGPADLDAVHQLQDGVLLRVVNPFQTQPLIAPKVDDAANFIAVVNQALALNPPPSADQAVLERIARVGIGPGAAQPDATVLEAWNAEFPQLKKRLIGLPFAEQPSEVHDGWTYSRSTLGNFGTDYDFRAIVALGGLAALPPAEAIYSGPVSDQTGEPLRSDRRYRFHLPAEGLPEDAFWSLSAYELTPEGTLFFADNAIHRYAVGDRTAGLVKNADGSLDILIQHDSPTGPLSANWLPIPSGPMRLTLRVYQPRKILLEGRYRFPIIEQVQ
jgi:hypothetical protein